MAGVVLFALMMVTVVDVAGRYFFNAPLPGGFEITELLMAAIVYVGIVPVSRREAHITIDLLDDVTPRRLVPPRNVLVHTACTACFAVFAWRLWELGGQIAEYGDVTEYLRLPRAPIIYVGATLFAMAALIHLFKLVRAHREMIFGQNIEEQR